MSLQPDSEQRSPQQTGKPFGFSGKPPSSFSPATVVNPERKGISPVVHDDLDPTDAAIVRRLFLSDDAGSNGDRPVGDRSQDPAGVELAHFVIEEPIGRGGMGAVFRAIDQRLQRVVAVKVLSPDQSQHHNGIQRFQNEARASARLDHDNIARVYYVGEDHGLHFIVYEFVTGQNIRDLIHATGRFDPAEAINYTLQVAAALKHTSAAGVVHRDIKPSNIIVTPTGRAKLVDLGLARKEYSESADELTVAGTTLGTFDYISPEQAKDPRNVDVRSDIYSLGCTLYQMLTGQPPYPEGTMYQKLLDHDSKEPPDPAKKNRQVTPELSAVVKKMMASSPGRRHADADELIRDLMTVAGQMGISTLSPEGLVWSAEMIRRPAGFLERHLGWMATAAALLLIVFLLDRFQDRLSSGLNDFSENPSSNVNSKDEPTELIAQTKSNSRDSSAADFPSKDKNVIPDNSDTHPRAEGPINNSSKPVIKPQRITVPVQGTENPKLAANDDGSLPNEDPSRTSLSNSPKSVDPSPANTKVASGSAGDSATQTPSDPVSPTTAKNTGNSTDGNTSPPVPTTVSNNIDKLPPISIADNSESEEKSFNTLEAACHEAEDGNVIKLRYNGRRPDPEKPLRIVDKKITILGEKGFRPVIEFRPQEDSTGEMPTRMISLIGGFGTSIELINVDLHIILPDNADSSLEWALISLQGAEQVRLQGVRVTFENAGEGSVASVFRLTSGPSGNLVDMKMMKENQSDVRQKFEIKISKTFVRGSCDLFQVAHTRPGRFFIERSAVAIDGTLLAITGDLEMPDENADIELQLEHVTCLLGNSLIHWDSGNDRRDVLPVYVTSRNNILSTKGDRPLIAMTGSTDTADFRQLLKWDNGARNFYDRFAMFWTIVSDLQMTETTSFDFDRWKSFWDGGTELDPHDEPVAWKTMWWDKEFSDLTVDDFKLDRNAPGNPAVGGALNGRDAGAVLDELPREPKPATAIEESETGP